MDEEIDVNKMAAEFVSQNIERFYNTGKDVLKGAADKIRLHLDHSYKDYLVCVSERYSKTKSFFVPNEPTYLYKFYVPLDVSCGKTKISKASIGAITSINPFAVIAGGGGSGKSILMRHLFLDSILQRHKVPIFLELRELNQTEQSLLDFIKTTLHSNHFQLDDEYIEKALKNGHFALLFDGFDEIDGSLRKSVSQQLLNLAKNYDQNNILVSSRPDDEFSGWAAFNVFQVDALTLEQANELVEKLPFDEELKSKFLKDLHASLFEKHRSFLSNPLLLSIMLLTYGQSADIPNKLSIFYNQAYEALFHRHDALKGGFKRERASNLDIQEFAKVFSAFSVQTYDKRMFQFSRSEALDYLEKSKKILNQEFNTSDYLQDLLQAVSLLIEEGLLIVFAHRSFQEYFAARFIFNSKPEVQQKLINKFSVNLASDNVLSLLFEMNPELVERTLIIPGLEKLEKITGVKNKVGYAHHLKFLKAAYARFVLEEGEIAGYSDNLSAKTYLSNVMSFALQHCGYLIGFTKFTYPDSEVRAIYKKYGGETPTSLSTDKFTLKTEFVRELANGNTFFSRKGLQAMLEIKNRLIQKHQNLDSSLETLLDI